MITELQKKTAQSIINIFETGHPQGEYGQVTLLSGDSGHLTYGRSQMTLASGNLYLLIKAYCQAPGAEFAAVLGEYLERLAHRDNSLDNHTQFRRLLHKAAADPIMRGVQDEFFHRVYWTPSVQHGNAMGINTPLGISVVYDSHIHGSWRRLQDRTNDAHGLANVIGQQSWIENYVQERRNWLADHSKSVLHKTVYRMDAFRQLIDAANWELALSFRVRGILIHDGILLGMTLLRLQTPNMQGKNVQEVQQGLVDAGFTITVDGVFGPKTAATVKQFQQQNNLAMDGIVGPVTRSRLGI